MSLNFPTAFWKTTENDQVIPELSISWVTGLAWSSQKPLYKSNLPGDPYVLADPLFTTEDTSTFPFFTDIEKRFDYAPYYIDYNSQLGPDPEQDPFYGWFLTGGYEAPYWPMILNDLTNLKDRMMVANPPVGWTENRRATPYEIGTDGTGLHFYYETDLATVEELEIEIPTEPVSILSELQTQYNNFIQSGTCTGTFNLAVPATFYIKMSGLGEDNPLGTDSHDQVEIAIDNISKVSGHAPKDGREDYPGMLNVYMNQLKFFTWNSNTVRNAGNGFCIKNTTQPPYSPLPNTPLPQYTNQSSCEAVEVQGEWITTNSEDVAVGVKAGGANRVIPETTTAGQWTYSQSLTTGSHTVEIKFSSNDGLYHSGSYVGFDFWTG